MATRKHKSIRWPVGIAKPIIVPDITLEKFGLIIPTFTQMQFLKELITYCNCYKHSLYWLPIFKLNKI